MKKIITLCIIISTFAGFAGCTCTQCKDQSENPNNKDNTGVITGIIKLDYPILVLNKRGDIKRIEYPQGNEITQNVFYHNENRYVRVTTGDGNTIWKKH